MRPCPRGAYNSFLGVDYDLTSRQLSQPIGLVRFDLRSFDFTTAAEDEDGMLRTLSYINRLISAEVDIGIDPGRIVVGGFSQGGTMSVLCGLTNERKLGGVVCLSGRLVLKSKIKSVSNHCLLPEAFSDMTT